MMPEDASDDSCNGDDVDELELHPSIKVSPSEISTYTPEKTNLSLDASSSTCSTNSVPSVVSNEAHKEYSVMIINTETSPNRSKNSGNKQSHAAEISDSSPFPLNEFERGDDASQKPLIQPHERTPLVEKQEPAATLPNKPHNDRPPNTQQQKSSSSPYNPNRKTPPALHQSKHSRQNETFLTSSIPPFSFFSSTYRSQHQKLNTISNPSAPPIPNPSPLVPSHFRLSYRNAMIGSSQSSPSPSSSSSSVAALSFRSVNPDPPCIDHRALLAHGSIVDDFPHLDIINNLLEEEQSTINQYLHLLHHSSRSFCGGFSLPVNAASMDSLARFGQPDDSFLGVYVRSSSAQALERIHAGWEQLARDGNQILVYNPADLSFLNLGGVDGGRMNQYGLHQNVSNFRNSWRGTNQHSFYWL